MPRRNDRNREGCSVIRSWLTRETTVQGIGGIATLVHCKKKNHLAKQSQKTLLRVLDFSLAICSAKNFGFV